MESKKLSQIATGTAVHVIGMRGGSTFKQKVTAMGISPGFEIEVIVPEPSSGGGMLIGVGNTRLMLGHGMAEKILVRRA